MAGAACRARPCKPRKASSRNPRLKSPILKPPTIRCRSLFRPTEAEARDKIWRENFRPHAIILTERTVPSPIFVAAMIGVENLLRIYLDAIQGLAPGAARGRRSSDPDCTNQGIAGCVV